MGQPSPGTPPLAGKTAFVTGAGAGIGRAIGLAVAGAGANVFVTDLDGAAAEETAESIGRSHPEVLVGHAECDVRDTAAVRRSVSSSLTLSGALHLAVNNAGVSSMAPVLELTEADWDHNMNVNAKGVFLCCQAQVAAMLDQGNAGAIVNIASMAGKKGSRLLAHYAASKFAVIGFTQSLALEAAPHGIRVNAVCPGYVRTAMHERELAWKARIQGRSEAEISAEWLRAVPLGRLEEPEDVADVAVFLLSDRARYMTGQAINVTGGAWMS